MNDTLAPICIASPLRRSGTTLLQRLLSSAPNALIYGESCANDLVTLTSLYANKRMLFEQNAAWRDAQLQEVLKGNVNDWIPDLMPEISGYIAAYKTSIMQLMEHYADFAKAQNRPVWGMKLPEWQPGVLALVQQLFPNAKTIYLHRNIADCVRSAKRMGMVQGLAEIQHFATIGQQFAQQARQLLQGENVLQLNYEAFLAEPMSHIAQLETFTGAKGIDSSVLDVKINTYDNDPNLELSDGDNYLKPDELSKEELAILTAFE